MAPDAITASMKMLATPGPRSGQLAVAEARLRVVAAGEIPDGVDAVNRGHREVGVAPIDARHLVVQVLDGSSTAEAVDALAGLAQERDEAPIQADLMRHRRAARAPRSAAAISRSTSTNVRPGGFSIRSGMPYAEEPLDEVGDHVLGHDHDDGVRPARRRASRRDRV